MAGFSLKSFFRRFRRNKGLLITVTFVGGSMDRTVTFEEPDSPMLPDDFTVDQFIALGFFTTSNQVGKMALVPNPDAFRRWWADDSANQLEGAQWYRVVETHHDLRSVKIRAVYDGEH